MVTQFTDKQNSQRFPFRFNNTRAAQLNSDEKKYLSIQALARTSPITALSAANGVSRKFIYKNAAKAEEALNTAFESTSTDNDVLFTLPITKAWIRRFVLGLILICHASFRGVIELLRDLFNYENISLGTIHNIVRQAVVKARTVNNAENLSQIRVGANDEIFQANNPVLVGCDVHSSYCYLLSAEEHRDGTTWGVHLLDLSERGFKPDYTIADGGKGLRAGQVAAWENVPCHADVFHVERELTKLASYLERRALGCISACEKLEHKMKRAKQRSSGRKLSKKLGLSRQAEAKALELAQDIQLLTDWIKNDILSLSGPESTVREELFDFVIKELSKREHLCAHRIAPVRNTLQNQKKEILAFTHVLDEKLAQISDNFSIPKYLVYRICELQGISKKSTAYWQKETSLRRKLYGKLYDDVQADVLKAMADTPRASSIVENLNSRLRNYFFLRKQIGNEYLELLRFFLNHRRFMRSECPERVNKSPAEVMTRKSHSHWLDLLDAQDSTQN